MVFPARNHQGLSLMIWTNHLQYWEREEVCEKLLLFGEVTMWGKIPLETQQDPNLFI